MTGKEIALTVGGVVVTLFFSWYLYEKQTSTTSTATTTDNTQSATDAALTSYSYDPTPSVAIPSLSTTTTSSDSEGSSSLYDPSQINNMVSGILANFTGTITSNESDFTSQLNHTQAVSSVTPTSPSQNVSVPLTSTAPSTTLTKLSASLPRLSL